MGISQLIEISHRLLEQYIHKLFHNMAEEARCNVNS
jgi:hypothetical protein